MLSVLLTLAVAVSAPTGLDCGCASDADCLCASGKCGCATCQGRAAAKPAAGKPTKPKPAGEQPGNPWLWDADGQYWWRWKVSPGYGNPISSLTPGSRNSPGGC